LGRIGDRRQGLTALVAGEDRAQEGDPFGAQPFRQLQIADLVSQVGVRLAVKTGHELFQLDGGDSFYRVRWNNHSRQNEQQENRALHAALPPG
jgi:hypothetical protein